MTFFLIANHFWETEIKNIAEKRGNNGIFSSFTFTKSALCDILIMYIHFTYVRYGIEKQQSEGVALSASRHSFPWRVYGLSAHRRIYLLL